MANISTLECIIERERYVILVGKDPDVRRVVHSLPPLKVPKVEKIINLAVENVDQSLNNIGDFYWVGSTDYATNVFGTSRA